LSSTEKRKTKTEEPQTSSDLIDKIKALVQQGFPSEEGVPVRCLSLVGGRIVFGILLSELSDSIMMGLTSTLVSDGSEVSGKLISTEPVMRLFKANIGFLVEPEKDHLFYYYKHISSHLDKMPEFFTSLRLNTIRDLLSTHEPEPFLAKKSLNLNTKSASETREHETEDDFMKDMLYASMNPNKVTKH
jgi:hypothetical protein